MDPFGARLHEAVAKRGPLCIGIDPHASLLTRWGYGDDVDGLARFSRTVVDTLGDFAAVFKPQSAFYERFGAQGIAVLESTIRQLRAAGALILLDVKRGVVGATVGETGHDFTLINGPILAPGIGAQGASAADLRRVFGTSLSGVLPAASREILSAGPEPDDLRRAAAKVHSACQDILAGGADDQVRPMVDPGVAETGADR